MRFLGGLLLAASLCTPQSTTLDRSPVTPAAANSQQVSIPDIPAQHAPAPQVEKAAGAARAAFFPLGDIRPGMRGIGKTVFFGSRVETFQVEILGVIENAGPKQSLILARLSGGPLEETGVMAGMSGSPVYIDGRLAGAGGEPRLRDPADS